MATKVDITRGQYDKVVEERDKLRTDLAGVKGQLREAHRELGELQKRLSATESMLESARRDAASQRARAAKAEEHQVVVQEGEPVALGPTPDQARVMYSPREIPPPSFEFANQAEADEAISRDGEGSWFAYAGDAEAEYHRRQSELLADDTQDVPSDAASGADVPN